MQIDRKTALVLEGGGMRGVFTSGVLDAFMKHDLTFPSIVADGSHKTCRCRRLPTKPRCKER